MKFVYLILMICTTSLWADWGKKQKLYYAIEMNNKLVGYAAITIGSDIQGNPVAQSTVHAKMTLVGGFADYEHKEKVKFSAEHKPYFYDNTFTQGQTKGGAITYITEGKARIISRSGGGLRNIKIPTQTEYEVYPYYNFLKSFKGEKRSYSIFNDLLKKVENISYEKLREEQISLSGKSYQATVFLRTNKDSKEQETLWIDISNGQVLKSQSTGSTISLSNISIIDKIQGLEKGVSYTEPRLFSETGWQQNKIYKYRYSYGGKDVGSDSFSLSYDEETEVSSFHSKISIKGLETTTKWQIKKDMQPLIYELKGKHDGNKYFQSCKFQENSVLQKFSKNGNEGKQTIKFKGKIRLFAENSTGLFASLLSIIPLRKQSVIVFDLFNATTGKVVLMKVKVTKPEVIVHNERKVRAWKMEILLGRKSIHAWVDLSGLLIKKQQGASTIERIE